MYEQQVDVATIGPDSSASFANVGWDIAGQTGKHFQVNLSLVDGQGKEISANEYMLLVGDQQAARRRLKQLGEGQAEMTNDFTYGNYYRFFPDMIRQEGRDWQSSTQTPRAG